jgi:hypothetical protein
MEADSLQLAISYAELAQSLAFHDFLMMQAMESERLELLALNAPATQFEECRSAIIAWQQHRRIVRSLEELVKDAQDNLKSAQLETQDARPDPSRTDRSGW